MSDLNFLLRRINQRASDAEGNRLEDAATAMLIGLLVLITLAALL
jgi:hypothetical protein